MTLDDLEKDYEERRAASNGNGHRRDKSQRNSERNRDAASSPSWHHQLFSIEDVLALPSIDWRVERLLAEGALSMIYAPQSQCKTFFALDLALSVAHDVDFLGRRVKSGPTVYILAEGRGGLKNRIRAWLKEHGISKAGPAFFMLEAVQFKTEADVATLKARVDGLNVKPAMLFIDTFARNAVGIDENQAKDVGLWIDSVTRLQQEMGVDVVALHHAQKPNAERTNVRERGSSAFIGAVDAAIRLKREGNTITVTCEKQKDAEHFEPFALALKTIALAQNESSCVLVPADTPAAHGSDLAVHLSRSERLALKVLSEHGPLQSGDWRLQIEAEQQETVASRTFQNWREGLVRKGKVEEVEEGSSVYRVTKTDDDARSANSTPSADVQSPSSASNATTSLEVACGTGEALRMAGQSVFIPHVDSESSAHAEDGTGSEQSQRPKPPTVGSE